MGETEHDHEQACHSGVCHSHGSRDRIGRSEQCFNRRCLSAFSLAALIQTAAASEKADTPDPAQIGRGAKAWAETCGNCHNLRDPKEFSDKNWDVIVNHMRVVGPLPGQLAEDIKAFLKSSN